MYRPICKQSITNKKRESDQNFENIRLKKKNVEYKLNSLFNLQFISYKIEDE